MAGSTINGNVGGSAFQFAQVQCLNVMTKQVSFGNGDSNGNYTIPSLAAGTYVISAFFSADVYYHPVQVIVDGTSTFGGINLAPTALNANNAPVQAGNY